MQILKEAALSRRQDSALAWAECRKVRGELQGRDSVQDLIAERGQAKRMSKKDGVTREKAVATDMAQASTLPVDEETVAEAAAELAKKELERSSSAEDQDEEIEVTPHKPLKLLLTEDIAAGHEEDTPTPVPIVREEDVVSSDDGVGTFKDSNGRMHLCTHGRR